LEELATLFANVDSPYLGLTFDSGNCLRILDDPVKGLERLADRVFATHIKDIRLQRGMPADRWQFFACVPAGEGVVDLPRIVGILQQSGYRGMLTVELDYLHSDYENEEDRVLALSIENLRKLI
jgi:sugar phosphate isomerase/epimerase